MGPSAQGPDALIGQIVAGYRLERVLGVGATGAVFLGTLAATPTDATPAGAAEENDAAPASPAASSLPATAAIKLLFVPWQLTSEQAEEFRRRFLREAATLSQLRHPHLLPVLASGRDDATGHLYMVMPHIAGTLAARLTTGGALALDAAASILDQLAGALDYAHSQGVIHRDIKPANILLDEQGGVYLGDFGILRLLDESRTQLTATGGVLGTPEYMAPEQARGDDAGPAADRYSLAVVLYQMVTGHLPFEGGAPASVIVRQMQDPPPVPRAYRNDLPQPAEAVILKGLAKRPEDRFPLASQMAEAFTLGLAGILSPLVTPTAPQQAQTLNDGRVMETPAIPPPSPLPWTPYPEAPALTAGAVAGVVAPSRRRKGLLWGSLGAAVLLLLTAVVLAALLRPDLAQALLGGRTATATATATAGQEAQVQPTAPAMFTAIATPRPTATLTATVTAIPPLPTATTVPLLPTATTVPPPPTIDIHVNIGSVQTPNATVQTAVSCDPGEVMVGGGARAEGILFSDYPIGSMTWVAEGSGSYVGQHVFVYAVCVSQPGMLTTMILSSSSVSISGGGDARVSCPGGWMLVGGGFQVAPGPSPLFGNGGAFNLVITGSTFSGNTWDSYAVGQSGEQLQTYAVCAQNVFTSTYVRTATASSNPGGGADITLSCTGSDLLTDGGGADITITSAQSMSLNGSYPDSSGSTWHYNPANDQDTQPHNGEVFIMCATL